MTRHAHPVARRGGFTLVELLVALALIGLISTALFAGLRLGVRSWTAGSAALATTDDVAATRRFLRQRLQEIRPLAFQATAQEPTRAVFDGAPRRLRFAAPWPLHLGYGGPFVFELRPGPDGRGLWLDWGVFRADGAVALDDGRTRPRELLSSAGRAQFRYYGRQPANTPARWHRRWQAAESLPRLIELRITGDAAGTWPPLRVAVAARPAGDWIVSAGQRQEGSR